ncbi:MAG: glycosyl transferase family 2, partial [Variibacter sp.]
MSYAPYHGSLHPDKGNRPTPDQIRSDLKILAPYTRALRTYSSTGGGELVPGIANEFGLRVTIGAWIDKDQKRNERELKEVVDLAKHHRNVNGIVVGNETIYRDEIKVPELIKLIQKVKREVQVPVTTGEIWSVWRDHPELVSAVDFIAVHILPYWEGVPEKAAVEAAIGGYNQLRQMYPGKRIVIAEFGWPSAGYNFKDANPGRLEQAAVLRDFVSHADSLGIDYNIVEATDQPWKVFEGSVGPYWGIFDNSLRPKFSWTGPLTDTDHWKVGSLALLIGFLLSLPILTIAGATAGQAALLATAANVVGAWFATIFAYWNGHYFVPGATFALAV